MCIKLAHRKTENDKEAEFSRNVLKKVMFVYFSIQGCITEYLFFAIGIHSVKSHQIES